MAVLNLLRLLLLWSFFLQHPTSRLHRIVTCDCLWLGIIVDLPCENNETIRNAIETFRKNTSNLRQTDTCQIYAIVFKFLNFVFKFFAASTASKSCAVLVRPWAEVKSTARQREDTTQKQKQKKNELRE